MMRTSPSSAQAKASDKGTPPLLLNLVVDVFTRILSKVATKGYLQGFMQSVCPEGITSLQYADDTLLFLKHDYMRACHLK
jgi:hypothetical protein